MGQRKPADLGALMGSLSQKRSRVDFHLQSKINIKVYEFSSAQTPFAVCPERTVLPLNHPFLHVNYRAKELCSMMTHSQLPEREGDHEWWGGGGRGWKSLLYSNLGDAYSQFYKPMHFSL